MPFTDRFAARRRTAGVAAAVIATCAVAGVAIAERGEDTTQHRLASAKSATSPSSAPESATRAFGILRQPTAPVPEAVTDAFAKSPEYRSAFAPNTSLAQALPVTNPYTGTRPYVVPGDEALCLYVPDTEGAGLTCATLAEAKEGRLRLILTPVGKPAFSVGLVPDGTDSVELTNADGSTETLRVVDNVYSLHSADARQVKIGDLTLAIPQAPKLPGS